MILFLLYISFKCKERPAKANFMPGKLFIRLGRSPILRCVSPTLRCVSPTLCCVSPTLRCVSLHVTAHSTLWSTVQFWTFRKYQPATQSYDSQHRVWLLTEFVSKESVIIFFFCNRKIRKHHPTSLTYGAVSWDFRPWHFPSFQHLDIYVHYTV